MFPACAPSSWKLCTAFAVVYIVWGSTYFAIKIAVRTLPPLFAAGTRFAVAASAAGGDRRSCSADRCASTVVRQWQPRGLGVLMLCLGVGMVHVAETRIDSSIAAMIAGSVPLQIVLMRLAVGEPVARATKLFAALGLCGLALVVIPGSTTGTSTALGLLIMVGSSIAWASGSFLSRWLPLPDDAFVATVYEMLGGGLALLALSLFAGEWGRLDADSFAAGPVLAWLYLAIAGSVIGFSAYAWLLKHAPISQVVTHQYVNPIVAIGLGVAVLGETIGVAAAIGATLVLTAVFFTVRAESRGREDEHAPASQRRDSRLARVILEGEGLAELHTHLGGSVASDILWSLAHDQGIALPVKDYWAFDALVTVSGSARRREPRRARPDLPLDRADPVVPARRRAVGARRDRRCVPIAGDHDARAALQPDEAQPWWRARPRPHHPRRDPWSRSREPRVPAGAVRADPDDGPDVRHASERGDRREGDPLVVTGRRRCRHRRSTPGRRAVRLRADLGARGDGAREAGLGVTIHVGEEGETGAEEIGDVVETLRPDRIGHGILAAGDPGLMAAIDSWGSCSRSARRRTC